MQSSITRIMDAAKHLLKAGGYFVDTLWHVDDVRFICEQMQLPALSDEEAMEVFVVAHEQFDGEHGISWPQLQKALELYLERKRVLASLREDCPA